MIRVVLIDASVHSQNDQARVAMCTPLEKAPNIIT